MARVKNDELPACPFPKGKEAGITCSSVQKIWSNGRYVFFCQEPDCRYCEDGGYFEDV